jgi:hypothetical protein
MAKVEFARDRLRDQLSKLIDEYEAMLVLLAKVDLSVKEKLQTERDMLPLANKRQLQVGIQKFSATINRIRRATGATQPIGRYTSILSRSPYLEGRVRSIPAYLALVFFSKYPRVAEALERYELPAHAMIELDCSDQYHRSEVYEYRLPEAMLFEDMCCFWNESCTLNEAASRPDSKKYELKRLIAFHRAAVSSAFYMVEAFCNGIALEVVLSRRDELSEREFQMVTEWDTKNSRPKYITMRDKIIHYPRLLMAAASPLIQENNSPELSYFLSSAKQLRDAIVHANPAPDYETFELPDKTRMLESLDHEECAKVVDCAIAVIDQIGTVTGRRKAAFWLQNRLEDGPFDSSVFD